ncbi:MAG: hypothetical protein DWQ45_07015 [Planctomycetota bacterium]|nr:MAG: hypothetical protein DWQ29_15790 [Planctomycetota bacterium]REK30026.1 MAG: hypothetical protein DWQ41_02505 [Planctomycetota bacterium]REK37731.1 MAG: hypothetical protein DWQ45_07015 [Planctomycetota bacterium]
MMLFRLLVAPRLAIGALRPQSETDWVHRPGLRDALPCGSRLNLLAVAWRATEQYNLPRVTCNRRRR